MTRVDLYVDGGFVATADLNQPRYDVMQAYPWYTSTPFARPGFATSFDSATLTDGSHTLFVRVAFNDGTEEDFGERTVTVDNDLNQAPFGELEMPGADQPMSGVFPVTGWALDDSELRFVEIMVDGVSVGNAVTGIHRPDIMQRFPSHPDAADAGFVKMLNTTHWANGIHVLSVRLVDDENVSRTIGTRYVQTFNVNYNLPPFGAIDWPISNHIMYAKGCQDPGSWSSPPYEDPQVTELITGWALDVGAQTDDGGVGYVQLLIDGTVLADTSFPGFYHPWFQMDVNYYGLPRMDILRLFSDVPNAKDSGFAFVLDVSDLIIRKGYRQGLHYLKIRAGDLENNVADIAQIPVIFDCDDDPDRPSWGDIYTPDPPGAVVTGTVDVTGWAIDLDSIEIIEVWVDGEYVDVVDEMDLPTPEVQDRYLWLPTYFTANAGYSYALDTVAENLADGEHVLVIWTEDRWGGRTFIGERRFIVDNS
ncbi:MAG: Ig-like domain-containing protein, partial [Holophagae bacterium]